MLREAISTREAGENFDVVAFVEKDAGWQGYSNHHDKEHPGAPKLERQEVERVQKAIIAFYTATFELNVTISTRFLYRHSWDAKYLKEYLRASGVIAKGDSESRREEDEPEGDSTNVHHANESYREGDSDSTSVHHASESDREEDLNILRQAQNSTDEDARESEDSADNTGLTRVPDSSSAATADDTGLTWVPIQVYEQCNNVC